MNLPLSWGFIVYYQFGWKESLEGVTFKPEPFETIRSDTDGETDKEWDSDTKSKELSLMGLVWLSLDLVPSPFLFNSWSVF